MIRNENIQQQNADWAPWNATTVNFPDGICLHQLFEEQVRRTPDAVAVTFGESSLTYQQLDQRADQIAHYLRSLGVGPDVVVALCCDRSFAMIEGLLGILKAGGAYLPLDPQYPEKRLTFILHDAQAALLLTQAHLQPTLAAVECPTIALDHYPFPTRLPAAPAYPPAAAHQLAYLIYTSGSTGQPKGVRMPHRALCNLIQWQLAQPGWAQPANTLNLPR